MKNATNNMTLLGLIAARFGSMAEVLTPRPRQTGRKAVPDQLQKQAMVKADAKRYRRRARNLAHLSRTTRYNHQQGAQ